MRTFSKLLTFCLILIVLLSASLVFAQDDGGLSDDEQAILDRVIALAEAVDEYESFVVDYTSVSSTSTSMAFGPAANMTEEYAEVNTVATVIRGDSVNVSAVITANVESFEDDVLQNYTIEAEARYVDETLYVNIIDILPGEGGEAPMFTTGWQEVDEMFPFYEDLDIESFSDLIFIEDMEEDEPDIDQIMSEAATSVSVEDGEIDGMAVEIITVSIGYEGVMALMAEQFESEDQMQQALMGMFAEMLAEMGDLVTYTIAVDENENVVGLAIEVLFALEEIDLGILDESFAGGSMSLVTETLQVIEFSQINEMFEPVEAPE